MNLLNGLAVSDTRDIQDQAEMISYISKVETISYAESVLLGDPFGYLSDKNSNRWIENFSCLSYMSRLFQSKVAQIIFQIFTGNKGILLFYDFLSQKTKVVRPNKKESWCNSGWQVKLRLNS